MVKIGDLVVHKRRIVENDDIFLVLKIKWTGCGYMAQAKNIKTGLVDLIPPEWLTKIKMDKNCP